MFNFLKGKKKPLESISPISYRIYDFMKKEAVGYSKRIKSGILMKKFNINDNKSLRSYIEEIRKSEVLQKIICSEAGSCGGYWIATNEEEVEQTLEHLYKRAMEMLKTYSKIKNKSKLNKQYRMKLSKYEKDIYESIMEEK